jgi:hypothetical protein
MGSTINTRISTTTRTTVAAVDARCGAGAAAFEEVEASAEDEAEEEEEGKEEEEGAAAFGASDAGAASLSDAEALVSVESASVGRLRCVSSLIATEGKHKAAVSSAKQIINNLLILDTFEGILKKKELNKQMVSCGRKGLVVCYDASSPSSSVLENSSSLNDSSLAASMCSCTKAKQRGHVVVRGDWVQGAKG